VRDSTRDVGGFTRLLPRLAIVLALHCGGRPKERFRILAGRHPFLCVAFLQGRSGLSEVGSSGMERFVLRRSWSNLARVELFGLGNQSFRTGCHDGADQGHHLQDCPNTFHSTLHGPAWAYRGARSRSPHLQVRFGAGSPLFLPVKRLRQARAHGMIPIR
jgi:hypothetical protein